MGYIWLCQKLTSHVKDRANKDLQVEVLVPGESAYTMWVIIPVQRLHYKTFLESKRKLVLTLGPRLSHYYCFLP